MDNTKWDVFESQRIYMQSLTASIDLVRHIFSETGTEHS